MRSSGAPEDLSSPKREGSGLPVETLEGIPAETVAVPGFESLARSVARALKAPLVALILTDGSTLAYAAEGDRRAQGWAHAPHPFDTEAAHWRVPHVVLDTFAKVNRQTVSLDSAPVPIRFCQHVHLPRSLRARMIRRGCVTRSPVPDPADRFAAPEPGSARLAEPYRS